MGLFLAFVISALTSVFESVGDYHTAARVSDERSPPSHAINRGIIAEGFFPIFLIIYSFMQLKFFFNFSYFFCSLLLLFLFLLRHFSHLLYLFPLFFDTNRTVKPFCLLYLKIFIRDENHSTFNVACEVRQ